MEVRLDPDTVAKLARLAAERGISAEMLAREPIERLVDYDEWFLREVDRGLASTDAGKFLTHDEVGQRLERLIRKKRRA